MKHGDKVLYTWQTSNRQPKLREATYATAEGVYLEKVSDTSSKVRFLRRGSVIVQTVPTAKLRLKEAVHA